jgi:arginyl-tRNA synthetase
LSAAGYAVHREYYVNDAGAQIGKFGATLQAHYAQLLGRDEEIPEDGYAGAYMREYAENILADQGPRLLDLESDAARSEILELGIRMVLEEMRAVLGRISVSFDTWFSERGLYENGLDEEVFAELRTRDLIEEREGATWLATSKLGSDRDEVLIRSNGQPGYYASDLLYHYDKFRRRGFDEVIDVWAVDHQNQARRMPFLMRALGLDPDRLTIVLYDLVKLVEFETDPTSGETAKRERKMSKRAGSFLALEDVLEHIPPDAIRFLMLSRSNEQVLELDLELAKAQDNENPVYYVQYAHARICGILRLAEGEGDGFGELDSADASLLTHPAELDLIRQILRLPERIEMVVADRAPHHLTHYALDLARAFHGFYHACKVIDPAAPDSSLARLALVDSSRIAFARVLDLLGMSAPERM